jgi:hypothetical protein
MGQQLELSLGELSMRDLNVLIELGWAEPVGKTKDGAVYSYALTGAGRIMVAQAQRQEASDDGPPPECLR